MGSMTAVRQPLVAAVALSEQQGIDLPDAIVVTFAASPELQLAARELARERNISLLEAAAQLFLGGESEARHGPDLPLRTATEPAFGGRPAPTESATETAMRLSKELAAREGITEIEAAAKLFEERPGLYWQYRRASTIHAGPHVIGSEVTPSTQRQGTESATARAMKLAAELAEREGISIVDATTRIFRENRSLYEQYRKENTIGA